MLQISFKGFEFAFKCFESLSNGLNFDLNASNPFRICIQMVRIFIRKLRIRIRMFCIPFKWFEFAFEYFERDLNASNPFECLEFDFEYFESRSNVSNLHSNALNTVRMVRICI